MRPAITPMWFLRAGALLAASGCGALTTVEGPGPTVRAYRDAVERGDADAVHALYDEETRVQIRKEDVARLLEENGDELRDQVGALDDPERASVETRAEVTLASGERVVLRIEDGRWVIDGGVLDVPALQTPEDAVLALRHALHRRSLRSVLRVLARGPRAELEAELDAFLEETEDPLDLHTEVQGNAARVRLTGGRTVILVRESGEWRVVDVQ